MTSNNHSKQFNLRLIIFLTAALATTLLLASLGNDWGIAYGQTAGRLDLVVTKRVNPLNTSPGATAVFTMVVTNASPAPLNNVVVNDTIPDQLQVISASSTKGSATTSGQQVTVDLGTLAPEESVTITVTVKVKDGTADGPITNKVTAQAKDGDRTITREATAVLSISSTSTSKVPTGDDGGIIPGLPRTGGGLVTDNNSSALWRIILLAGSITVMLGSLIALLKTGKKGISDISS